MHNVTQWKYGKIDLINVTFWLHQLFICLHTNCKLKLQADFSINHKNRNLPILILLPSWYQTVCYQTVCYRTVCYQTVCYQTVCYQTVCYQTVQKGNHIQSCSLNQQITTFVSILMQIFPFFHNLAILFFLEIVIAYRVRVRVRVKWY